MEGFQEPAGPAAEVVGDRPRARDFPCDDGIGSAVGLVQEVSGIAPWDTSHWSGATLAELGPLMMEYLEKDSTENDV